MKYGFEKEYFVQRKGEYVLCPTELPMDECGYLAEVRGDPHSDPLKAAYLFLAAEYDLFQRAKKLGVKLLDKPSTVTLSPELLRLALRTYGKNSFPVERGSMYDKDYPADDNFARAGLHVHFSNEQVHTNATGTPFTYSGFIDVPRYIKLLDKAFIVDIEASNRIPGLYETKLHGFEYRSLPSCVNPIKIADVLSEA